MLHGSGYKVSVTAHWVKQLKLYSTFTKEGFPGGSDGKESVCNAGDLVRSLGWEDPLEKELATHSSILAWRIPRQKRLVGYSPRGGKESDMTDQLTPLVLRDQNLVTANGLA